MHFPAGAAPVTEKASPMNQLVEKTAALATMQRAVTDVSESFFHLSCIHVFLSTFNQVHQLPFWTFPFQLQVKVTTAMAANRTGGQVRTDFSAFPTPSFAKASHNVAFYVLLQFGNII